MKIVNPSFGILNKEVGAFLLQRLEQAGRVCYQSEPRGNPELFVQSLIKAGHHSVLEHESISVRLIIDRGVSHELVRHRHAAYSQESTRYCDYNKGDIEFIKPHWYDTAALQNKQEWEGALRQAETFYRKLRSLGFSPQDARGVLPNALKTTVVMTANIREWRHVLSLRTSKAAHPDIRLIMSQVLVGFQGQYPVLFDDIRRD